MMYVTQLINYCQYV